MKRILTLILICIFASCFVFAEESPVYRFVYLDGRMRFRQVYETYLDYEYDENSNIIRTTSSDGSVFSFSYDEHGNMTDQNLSDFGDYSRVFEYDDQGRVVYYSSSSDFSSIENWVEYDENGNAVVSKVIETIDGVTTEKETHLTYDDRGNILHTITTDVPPVETWYEYDSEGRCIREHMSTGEESRVEYYPNGGLKKTYFKGTDYETLEEFDEYGNSTYSYSIIGPVVTETRFVNTYDKQGRFLRTTDNNDYDVWYAYDSYGNIEWYTYKSDGEVEIDNYIYYPGTDVVNRLVTYTLI
jgi:YD repeat-containing protein